MPKVYKYKIHTGRHENTDGKTYGPGHENGDVFVTEQSTLLQHNHPGMKRFSLLKEDVPTVTEPVMPVSDETPTLTPTTEKQKDDGLDKMTVAELRSFAADAEIDILGLNKKDELIATIRRAVG